MKSELTAIKTTTKPRGRQLGRPFSAFARFKCSVANSKNRTAAAVSVVRNSRRRQRSIYDKRSACSFPF
jgi:hypothetical protein